VEHFLFRTVRGEPSHRDLSGNFAELKHRWDSGKSIAHRAWLVAWNALRVDLMTRGSFAETKSPAAAVELKNNREAKAA